MSSRAEAAGRRTGRPWPWPAFLFGGWWALSRGWLVAGSAAIGLPFLALWYGRPASAAAILAIGHLLLGALALRTADRPGRCLLAPLTLPLVVVGATAALACILKISVELLGTGT